MNNRKSSQRGKCLIEVLSIIFFLLFVTDAMSYTADPSECQQTNSTSECPPKSLSVDTSKGSIEPYLQRMRMLEKQSRYDEAIVEGEMAVEMAPDDERAYAELRAAYMLAGKYRDAQRVSEQLLQVVRDKNLPVCGFLDLHTDILERLYGQSQAILFLEDYREACPDTVEKLVGSYPR